MYDSTDLTQIPKEPHAVAAYGNGEFANYDAALKMFPNARVMRGSVRDMVAADWYDIERGDYRPDQAGALFKVARDAGIWRPCFYFSLANRNAVLSSLSEATTQRDTFRLWDAYWNAIADIMQGDDAHQFTDKALNRNLDETICLSTFFPPAPTPTVEVMTAKVEFTPATREWDISPLPLEHEPAKAA